MAGATYLNPLTSVPCPDPFVLKYCGEYWVYCTGLWRDGRCFGVLHSRNLVDWEALGGAMAALPGNFPCYWAPEVTYHNGRFFLYYSVGNEMLMEIRVAVAERPAGPFVDSGHTLTKEDFAIDPHVFTDDDGTRYLFYATDFLQHSHIGTGTVYDRMLDMFTLAGRPRPVSRARYPWQVYDPRRSEKGGVCWYTVEGPFVLKHKDRYYQMFSGGNWKNIRYGVSYAHSDRVDADEEWQQVCDGERVLPVLRTLPGHVVGPGHNSVIRGPDNRQCFCVYHRWSAEGDHRVLAIDRLEWVGDRIVILGPSITAQPAPLPPTLSGFSGVERADGLGPEWRCTGGRWSVRDSAARQESLEVDAEARVDLPADGFRLEVSQRRLAHPQGDGTLGLRLYNGQSVILQCALSPSRNTMTLGWLSYEGWVEQRYPLPDAFDPAVYHFLRLDVDGCLVDLSLDGTVARWRGHLKTSASGVGLFTLHMSAAFAGFAVTVGWEDLFMQPNATLMDLGWKAREGETGWRLDSRALWYAGACGAASTLMKGPLMDSYEMVVNARLASEDSADACYGFYPSLDSNGLGPRLSLERCGDGWAVLGDEAAGHCVFPLPPDFDPFDYQPFRFRKQGEHLTIQWGAQALGDIRAPGEKTRPGLYARGAAIAFDMVRVIL